MCEATLEVAMVVERLEGPASGVGKHSPRGRAERAAVPGECGIKGLLTARRRRRRGRAGGEGLSLAEGADGEGTRGRGDVLTG